MRPKRHVPNNPEKQVVSSSRERNDASADVSSPQLLGAVLLIGSLFWEGELPEENDQQAKNRRRWRNEHLDMLSVRSLPGIPIRYARQSQNRQNQFTMTFAGRKAGVIKVANLRHAVCVEADGGLSALTAKIAQESEAMARVEGIRKEGNSFDSASWGLVAIGINPNAPFTKLIQQSWVSQFNPSKNFNHAAFGRSVVDRNGILRVRLPWAHKALRGVDFCLATPTLRRPEGRLRTPREIADAARAGSYFLRTSGEGIVTADDVQIRRQLAKLAVVRS